MKVTIKGVSEATSFLENLVAHSDELSNNLIYETLSVGLESALRNTRVMIGETADSTDVQIIGNKGVLSQTGTHVYENEFGQGTQGDQSLVPPNISYDTTEKGTDKWRFIVPPQYVGYFKSHGLPLRFDKETKSYSSHTFGQPPQRQMFTAFEDMLEELTTRILPEEGRKYVEKYKR